MFMIIHIEKYINLIEVRKIKKTRDYALYLLNILVLSFVSLINFKGMIISTLAYILTCNIIRER